MKLNYARKRNYPTGPTHCKTVEGYTDTALNGAIAQLVRSGARTRNGWEHDRLNALEQERDRREKKKGATP